MNIAQENTARALKEEPLFATRQWYCRFGIHTWLQWRDPVKVRRGAYDYVEQYRKCGCCGHAERRQLSKD
jgi:hypothetical protein